MYRTRKGEKPGVDVFWWIHGNDPDIQRAFKPPRKFVTEVIYKGIMGHILIVEDEESVRKFMTAALVNAGFQVTVLRNFPGNIDLNRHRFDLLIVGNKHDGIENAGRDWLIRLRERYPDQKTVLMTGGGNVKDAELLGEILHHPFNVSTLVSFVRRKLGIP